MKKPNTLNKDLIKTIYTTVFRQSNEQEGFYNLNLGSELDSKIFREIMVDLKNGLSTHCKQHLKKELHYQSLGRFNHQNTSKPHRDSADNHSFLILGYEPTIVESKAYITDYSKFIEEEQITLESFFGTDKEANLVEETTPFEKYKTEVSPFDKNDYRILIANNSRSYNEKTFGVFHSAEIPKKIKNHDRILNYMMLKLSDLDSKEQYTEQNIQEFLSTDIVNR